MIESCRHAQGHAVKPAASNAAKKFNQVDSYVCRRLHNFLVRRHGRNLKPGQADQWTRLFFWNHGLYRLRGTIRYPEPARC